MISDLGSLVRFPPHQRPHNLLEGLLTHSRCLAALLGVMPTEHSICVASCLYYATWAAPPQVDTFLILDRARPDQV